MFGKPIIIKHHILKHHIPELRKLVIIKLGSRLILNDVS